MTYVVLSTEFVRTSWRAYVEVVKVMIATKADVNHVNENENGTSASCGI